MKRKKDTTYEGDRAREIILSYIENYTRMYGIPPTMRQIRSGLNISSVSVVWYHVHELADQKKVYRVGDGKTIRYMPSNARVEFKL